MKKYILFTSILLLDLSYPSPNLKAQDTYEKNIPSSTSTETATSTASTTPTQSPSSTPTSTITVTAIDTQTSTITGTPTDTSTTTDTPTITPTFIPTPVQIENQVLPLYADIKQGGQSLLNTGTAFNKDAGVVKLFPNSIVPEFASGCHWVLVSVWYIPVNGLGVKKQIQISKEWSRTVEPMPDLKLLDQKDATIADCSNKETYQFTDDVLKKIGLTETGVSQVSPTPTLGPSDKIAFNRFIIDRMWDNLSAHPTDFYLDNLGTGKFDLSPGNVVLAIHEMYGTDYNKYIDIATPPKTRWNYWGLTPEFCNYGEDAKRNGIILFNPNDFFTVDDLQTHQRARAGDVFRIEFYPVAVKPGLSGSVVEWNGLKADGTPVKSLEVLLPSQTPTPPANLTPTPNDPNEIASGPLPVELGVPISCDIVIPADFVWKTSIGASLFDVQSPLSNWAGVRYLFASIAPRSDRLDSSWQIVNTIPAIALFPDISNNYNNPIFGFVEDPFQFFSSTLLLFDTRSPVGRALGEFDGDFNVSYIPTYNKVYVGFSVELSDQFFGNFSNLQSDVANKKYSTIINLAPEPTSVPTPSADMEQGLPISAATSVPNQSTTSTGGN